MSDAPAAEPRERPRASRPVLAVLALYALYCAAIFRGLDHAPGHTCDGPYGELARVASCVALGPFGGLLWCGDLGDVAQHPAFFAVALGAVAAFLAALRLRRFALARLAAPALAAGWLTTGCIIPFGTMY